MKHKHPTCFSDTNSILPHGYLFSLFSPFRIIVAGTVNEFSCRTQYNSHIYYSASSFILSGHSYNRYALSRLIKQSFTYNYFIESFGYISERYCNYLRYLHCSGSCTYLYCHTHNISAVIPTKLLQNLKNALACNSRIVLNMKINMIISV